MIKAILTDIEGTITRISFVKDILFPYAAKHLPAFVKAHQHELQVSDILKAVALEMNQDSPSLESQIDALLGWIKEDKKVTPLKQLQGLIWESGYREKDFTGHIYPDAHQFLTRAHEQALSLYVYSSGSVRAQHLLFEHSDYGDLRPLFKGYFDTHVGGKKSQQSYENIITELPFKSTEVLFLSDIIEELDAAQAAGLRTLQLWRDGQPRSDKHDFIENFEQIKSEYLS